MVEIYFNPNQNAFSASQYTADFQKALEISQTYNGALIVVEGHSDPLGVLKAERKGELRQVLNEMRQSAKNLSLERSQKVREAFLSFCVNKGINIDESQFLPIGLGVSAPKYSPPQTEAEWNANRRVVFRIKQMEAEMDSFVPLD
jgi:outer membrane protein OmpA-like peptidoglycan-associated protein